MYFRHVTGEYVKIIEMRIQIEKRVGLYKRRRNQEARRENTTVQNPLHGAEKSYRAPSSMG